MRTRTLALSILFSTTVLAGPALAQDCSRTAYIGLGSNYQYQDLGVYGSERPVVQGGHTTTCGAWSFDVWASAGERDQYKGANEIDLTVSYARTFESTPIGPVSTQWTVAYYAFDFDGLTQTRDDAYDFHVDVARPIKVGDATVAPFLRLTHIGFVNGAEGIDFVRPGVRLSGPVTDRVSYRLEASVSMNETGDIDTDRYQADLNWDVGDTGGWVVGVRGKLTEDLEPAGFITASFSY